MLSNRVKKILKPILEEAEIGKTVYIKRIDLPRSASTKKMSSACFHRDILFEWTNQYYCFKKTREVFIR